jgi:selenocysteine lyase/cysteine desulfurase
MATDQSPAADKAQQALDQIKQAIEANPDAVQQAATDAIAAVRAAIANLTTTQKAEIVVALRQLEAKVTDAQLKRQLAELVTQLNQSA